MGAALESAEAWVEERRRFFRLSRAPRIRSLLEFAEAEVVIPEGPFKGDRFRGYRQPGGTLYLQECAGWNRCAFTAPTQYAKTFCGWIIPTLYHLFELGESVICGVPDLDMAADKWRQNLKPAIEASRYRELLPKRGLGSRGSNEVGYVEFGNGASLKFMSGRGKDEERSGYTSRVVVITETDKFRVSEGSQEAHPIRQIEARTDAFGAERRIYLECTVSVEAGWIWQEMLGGTQSGLALPCGVCGAWVMPEREHLVGWQEAGSAKEAGERARVACPSCGGLWDEGAVREAVGRSVVVHAGEEVKPRTTEARRHGEGRWARNVRGEEVWVEGAAREVETFSFRVTALTNLFRGIGLLAQEEWKALRAEDEEDAEKHLLQFRWARPWVDPKRESVELTADLVTRRMRGGWGRGRVPAGTEWLVGFVDPGKYLGWYMVVAVLGDGSGHVVDYGSFEVPGQDMDPGRAVGAGLRTLRDELLGPGYVEEGTGAVRHADVMGVDCGYQPEAVEGFVLESGPGWYACRGQSVTQMGEGRYVHPKGRPGKSVLMIGRQYHLALGASGAAVLWMDVDHWKSFVHARLALAALEDGSWPEGAWTLFRAGSAREHTTLAKHVTAEEEVEEFVPGKGVVRRWKRKRKANHLLDCAVGCAVLGHWLGGWRGGEVEGGENRAPRSHGDTEEGVRGVGALVGEGRAWLVTDRS